MSIVITKDVFCDGCQNWTEGATGSAVTNREARANAAKHGYSRVRLDDGYWHDLCPECSS